MEAVDGTPSWRARGRLGASTRYTEVEAVMVGAPAPEEGAEVAVAEAGAVASAAPPVDVGEGTG